MAISRIFFKHFPSAYPFQTVKFFLLAIIIAVLAFGCKKKAQNPSPNPQPSPEIEWPSLSGPYFGQVLPDSVPLVFGFGYISTDYYNDFGGTYSPNMDEFCFDRNKAGENNKIMFTKILNGKWSEPVQIMKSVTIRGEAHIAIDNQSLYFGSSNGLYVSDRDSFGLWGIPGFFGPGMYISSTNDSSIYFTHITNGYDQAYLVKRELVNGLFDNQKAVLFDGPSHVRQHTFVAPDKNYLIYDSYGDMYYSIYNDTTGIWSEGIKLNSKINSPEEEIAPFVSPDGAFFFFTRNGKIYWIDMKYIF